MSDFLQLVIVLVVVLFAAKFVGSAATRAENQNRTLFTIVATEEWVDKVIAATQAITGDLNLPNTGFLVVLPVIRAYGLDRKV